MIKSNLSIIRYRLDEHWTSAHQITGSEAVAFAKTARPSRPALARLGNDRSWRKIDIV